MTTLPKQNETALVKMCLEFLRIERVLAWRNNTGRLAGSGRLVTFGLCPGSSDIIGLMPDGRFLAVECKIGKADPTALQAAFLQSINDQGGLAICVRSLDELMEVIKDETNKCRPCV